MPCCRTSNCFILIHRWDEELKFYSYLAVGLCQKPFYLTDYDLKGRRGMGGEPAYNEFTILRPKLRISKVYICDSFEKQRGKYVCSRQPAIRTRETRPVSDITQKEVMAATEQGSCPCRIGTHKVLMPSYLSLFNTRKLI